MIDELPAGARPPLRIKGYASVFDVRDLVGDTVRRGAFAASLAARGAAGVRMLFQHDAKEPIGTWDAIIEDERGLWVSGRILDFGPRARAAWRLVKAGAVDGLSIGFRAVRERQSPGVRELLEVELWEVSLVTFPMLSQARLSVVTEEPVMAPLIDPVLDLIEDRELDRVGPPVLEPGPFEPEPAIYEDI